MMYYMQKLKIEKERAQGRRKQAGERPQRAPMPAAHRPCVEGPK
jgi:hypothetical protein